MTAEYDACESSWQQLQYVWEQVEEQWHDELRERFKAEFWWQLEHDMQMYLDALAELEQLLRL